MEFIGKLLEYGVLGVTTVLFLVLWLRAQKEVSKHIDKRIETSERVLPAIIKATDTLKQFGEELHEGLEDLQKRFEAFCLVCRKANKEEEGG